MTSIGGFEVLAEALACNPHAASIYVDATGAIRSWNAGAELIFGHASHEAIGSRADIIVPGKYRAAHWAGFTRAFASPWRGSEAWGPIEALHQDGSLLGLEVLLLPVEGVSDLQGVLAMFRRRETTEGATLGAGVEPS